MGYIIKNESGQYWIEENDCFGVRQAATEYNSVDDLPLEIDYAFQEIFTTDPVDIRYYDDQDESIGYVEKI